MNKRKQGPIKIVVVDDSATSRELLTGIFRSNSDVQVVGTGFNGLDAVSLVTRLHPDVVVMDINMPKMDGFEATKRIMRESPTPIVLVTSSTVSQEMDLSFKALRAGALMVVNKPLINDPESFKEVVQTVLLMADVPVIHHWRTRDVEVKPSQPSNTPKAPVPNYNGLSEIQIVGIAASTGGPSALVTVLSELPKDFPLPILAVQHITEGFTEGFAAWLRTQLHLEVAIAADGEKPRPGVIYLAPDNYHLQVSAAKTLELSKDNPYKGLRPSANNLFYSLARIYGRRAMGIVLTGMGDDGAQGAEALYQAQGFMIAQDEESSVVYGMPREVKVRKVVNQVLSLEQIASVLRHLTPIGSRST